MMEGDIEETQLNQVSGKDKEPVAKQGAKQKRTNDDQDNDYEVKAILDERVCPDGTVS